MKLSIRAQLDYHFAEATDVLLQIEAAVIPEQRIESANINVSPCEHFARVAAHDQIGERIWVQAKGQLSVHYDATV
ncbi:MAG: transglutaminase family protein, partial [Sphingomonadales bacterium]